ncbi:MAG: hypothetical protein CMJ64_01185 [Planctomycetaceae bacterium]|nr:hypothetical protein [Planctomycetaceae bacterium]
MLNPNGKSRIKSWVPIAAAKNRKAVDRIHRNLTAHGFSVRTASRTTDYCVEIRYGDFEEALLVLRHGDRRTLGDWRMSDRVRLTRNEGSDGRALFIGLIVFGFATSVVLAMAVGGSLASASIASVVILFLLAATGFFCGFMVNSRR